MEPDYTKREIDTFLQDLRDTQGEILAQVKKTNGRVNRLERVLLVVGTAVSVLLFTNGSDLLTLFKAII